MTSTAISVAATTPNTAATKISTRSRFDLAKAVAERSFSAAPQRWQNIACGGDIAPQLEH
jgi:hypothetical protein